MGANASQQDDTTRSVSHYGGHQHAINANPVSSRPNVASYEIGEVEENASPVPASLQPLYSQPVSSPLAATAATAAAAALSQNRDVTTLPRTPNRTSETATAQQQHRLPIATPPQPLVQQPSIYTSLQRHADAKQQQQNVNSDVIKPAAPPAKVGILKCPENNFVLDEAMSQPTIRLSSNGNGPAFILTNREPALRGCRHMIGQRGLQYEEPLKRRLSFSAPNPNARPQVPAGKRRPSAQQDENIHRVKVDPEVAAFIELRRKKNKRRAPAPPFPQEQPHVDDPHQTAAAVEVAVPLVEAANNEDADLGNNVVDGVDGSTLKKVKDSLAPASVEAASVSHENVLERPVSATSQSLPATNGESSTVLSNVITTVAIVHDHDRDDDAMVAASDAASVNSPSPSASGGAKMRDFSVQTDPVSNDDLTDASEIASELDVSDSYPRVFDRQPSLIESADEPIYATIHQVRQLQKESATAPLAYSEGSPKSPTSSEEVKSAVDEDTLRHDRSSHHSDAIDVASAPPPPTPPAPLGGDGDGVNVAMETAAVAAVPPPPVEPEVVALASVMPSPTPPSSPPPPPPMPQSFAQHQKVKVDSPLDGLDLDWRAELIQKAANAAQRNAANKRSIANPAAAASKAPVRLSESEATPPLKKRQFAKDLQEAFNRRRGKQDQGSLRLGNAGNSSKNYGTSLAVSNDQPTHTLVLKKARERLGPKEVVKKYAEDEDAESKQQWESLKRQPKEEKVESKVEATAAAPVATNVIVSKFGSLRKMLSLNKKEKVVSNVESENKEKSKKSQQQQQVAVSAPKFKPKNSVGKSQGNQAKQAIGSLEMTMSEQQLALRKQYPTDKGWEIIRSETFDEPPLHGSASLEIASMEQSSAYAFHTPTGQLVMLPDYDVVIVTTSGKRFLQESLAQSKKLFSIGPEFQSLNRPSPSANVRSTSSSSHDKLGTTLKRNSGGSNRSNKTITREDEDDEDDDDLLPASSSRNAGGVALKTMTNAEGLKAFRNKKLLKPPPPVVQQGSKGNPMYRSDDDTGDEDSESEVKVAGSPTGQQQQAQRRSVAPAPKIWITKHVTSDDAESVPISPPATDDSGYVSDISSISTVSQPQASGSSGNGSMNQQRYDNLKKALDMNQSKHKSHYATVPEHSSESHHSTLQPSPSPVPIGDDDDDLVTVRF